MHIIFALYLLAYFWNTLSLQMVCYYQFKLTPPQCFRFQYYINSLLEIVILP